MQRIQAVSWKSTAALMGRPASLTLPRCFPLVLMHEQRSVSTGAVSQDSYVEQSSRSYAQYSVYKGKAAFSAKPIPPTWEAGTSQKGNTLQNVKRQGSLLLEFANVLPNQGAQSGFGNRNYDWGNRLSISLNVTELAQLADLPPTGSMSLYHDPDKNTPQEGTRGKKLSIAPAHQQDGTMFFGLSGRGASGQQSISVTVSPAEFKVLRVCAEFLIPRLIGLDEVMLGNGASLPAGQH